MITQRASERGDGWLAGGNQQLRCHRRSVFVPQLATRRKFAHVSANPSGNTTHSTRLVIGFDQRIRCRRRRRLRPHVDVVMRHAKRVSGCTYSGDCGDPTSSSSTSSSSLSLYAGSVFAEQICLSSSLSSSFVMLFAVRRTGFSRRPISLWPRGITNDFRKFFFFVVFTIPKIPNKMANILASSPL